MNELLLIASIAGRRVALYAGEILTVVDLDGLTPVPCAPAHIAGLSTLRSRILTVVDCRRALGLAEGMDLDAAIQAAVVEYDGHAYALMVDHIEDVTPALSEPAPMRTRLAKGWTGISRGMIETALGPLLLVDAGALIAGPAQAKAA
jgi:purine-binding chemotaxis protein CheW